MKVLVTGGAGFVGSHYVRHALETHPDWEIVNLDKLTYAGNLANLRGLEDHPRHRFVRGDICDSRLVSELTKGCALVVNFAAESHVDRSIFEPEPFVETNIKGTFTLLEAARRNQVARFVHTSTPEVYGGAKPGQRFHEESPLQPNNPYSSSKAAADLLCRAYHHTYGLPIVYTRFNNVYGPYQYPEKLVPVIVTRALQGIPIPIYGDGLDKRNWIYVGKTCEAIDTVIAKGEPGQAYNVGSEVEMTNLALAKLILDMLGKPHDLIVHVPNRPGHDYQYPLDFHRLIKQLGWNPHFDFHATLRQTVEWYTESRWWWEPLKPVDYGRLYAKTAAS